MTEPKTLATTIHDAIDEVTTAVEDIHQSIANVPLDVLGEIAPLKDAIDEVKVAQSHTIAAVYDLIRTVNDRVRQITTGIVGR